MQKKISMSFLGLKSYKVNRKEFKFSDRYMKKVLVLKTSSDNTMQRWFKEYSNQNNQIYCMIQSSQLPRYKKLYPDINYIDIKSEGFYNIADSVMKHVCSQEYDMVYVTLSGIVGHNYGNVMEIVKQLKFKQAFFYNCNGEKIVMPKMNVICEFICRLYIKCVEIIYG